VVERSIQLQPSRGGEIRITALAAVFGALTLAGCVSVKTQHKIDPIHITMDVNLRLEKELEATFSALDRQTKALADEVEQGGTP